MKSDDLHAKLGILQKNIKKPYENNSDFVQAECGLFSESNLPIK